MCEVDLTTGLWREDSTQYRRFLAQLGDWPPARHEMYVGKTLPAHIQAWGVVKVGPRTYRMVMLYRPGHAGGVTIHGHEGELNDVARSLRVFGVPIVRLSPPARVPAGS